MKFSLFMSFQSLQSAVTLGEYVSGDKRVLSDVQIRPAAA